MVVVASGAQNPILDLVAKSVIQKYQSSTCEQLWEARAKPKAALGGGRQREERTRWGSAGGGVLILLALALK